MLTTTHISRAADTLKARQAFFDAPLLNTLARYAACRFSITLLLKEYSRGKSLPILGLAPPSLIIFFHYAIARSGRLLPRDSSRRETFVHFLLYSIATIAVERPVPAIRVKQKYIGTIG